MPSFWYALSDCIPATWGVEGFVRINSNAGTLYEQSGPYMWLWTLTGVYFVASMILQKIRKKTA